MMLKNLHKAILFLLISFIIARFNVTAGYTEGQTLLINEVMSSNLSTIKDEDGDYPDWIEIYNPGASPVDLTGYGLSDDPVDPFKWIFPNYILKSGEYMLVFASDKNRTLVPGHWETVIQLGDVWRYFIGDSEPPENWRSVGFDDSGWLSGPGGFGSTYNAGGTSIPKAISLYIRKTFDIDDVANITHCLLQIDYQDAFVAYINGHEISRSNIGQIGIPPSYDEEPKEYISSRMFYGNNPDVFEIDTIQSVLLPGENVLAIQVHNKRKTYSDITVIPFLTSGMNIPPLNPRGVPDILKFSIPYLHTNFKISSTGETLQLTDNSGSICDLVETGAIPSNMSRGRQPDGGSELVFFAEPTPGESNTSTGQLFAGSVQVSLQGGFYTSSVTVTLLTNSSSAEILYTLDGSEPSSNSMKYENPISINKTTVLRARAFEDGCLPGEITSHTYFIEEHTTIPVVSLSINSEYLFDEDTGIYVKKNIYKDWLRPAHVEFFEPDGTSGFSLNADIKLVGGACRNYPQKSFAIYARGEYGNAEINYQIFPDLPITQFKSFILRNSGNGWKVAFFRSGLVANVIKGMDIDYLAFRPARFYLNGEYWGIMNIREKKNEDYMASHHPGVDPDNVDIINPSNYINEDGNWVYTNGVPRVSEGDSEHYDAMMEYVHTHDLSVPEHYEYVKTLIDMNSYIDFYVAGFCTAQCDWPGRNTKLWRPRTPEGKWRWLFFDADGSFSFIEREKARPDYNTFNLVASTENYDKGRNPPWSTYLFRALLENQSFRNDFSNRFADCANTIFLPNVVIKKIRDLKAVLEPEMPYHIERWSESVPSMEYWYVQVDTLEHFAATRQPYIYGHIVEKFNLSGTAEITLNVSDSKAGIIRINSIVPENYPWNGTYFKDVPVKLTALPNPGYTFTGWTGVEQNDFSSIIVTLTKDTSITAHFEEESSALNTIVINEINYNSSNTFDPEDWVELYNAYDIPVDISGWVFKDEDDAHIFKLPANTVITSNGYLVLCNDAAAFHNVFPDVSNYIGSFNFGLSGQGELIRLYDANGVFVDSLTYDDAFPWPVEPDGNGPTLALLNPARDNKLPEYWAASGEYGTPGEINDVYSGVDEDAETDVPVAFSLGQNYPNPFNSVTTIPFSVQVAGRVAIEVYSILGQRVAKILDDDMTPGQYNVVFRTDNIPSGLYLYTIKAGKFYKTKQMLLLK